MRELIKSTYKKWLEAKNYAAKRCRISNPKVSKQLEECTMFTGEESLSELIDLIFSPQGREFMLTNNFPNLPTFRKFMCFNPEQFKVYIDSGKIEIVEPGQCFLVGNTEANIICHELKANNIFLMHGAKAEVLASGYSVVHIEKDRKSKCDVFVKDNAKVL